MRFLKTPSSNLLQASLIQRVSHVPNRGVMLLDGYGRMLEFVKQEDDEIAIRIRDAINKVVLDGKRATQPDWSLVVAGTTETE